MNDYGYTEVTGESWQRASTITVSNPTPPENPTISFAEEVALRINGVILTKPIGTLSEKLVATGSDANIMEMFQPLDPQTLLPIGDPIPYAYAAAMLTGLYIHCASKRDAAITPTVNPEM